jgi:hypothetical protein
MLTTCSKRAAIVARLRMAVSSGCYTGDGKKSSLQPSLTLEGDPAAVAIEGLHHGRQETELILRDDIVTEFHLA